IRACGPGSRRRRAVLPPVCADSRADRDDECSHPEPVAGLCPCSTGRLRHRHRGIGQPQFRRNEVVRLQITFQHGAAMKLSLVIPCYNEAANLPLLAQRCSELASDPDIEVIFVDNGSTDATPSVLAELIADSPNCRSVRVEHNQGYGFGVLSGLREARGRILAWTHADMQNDPQDVLRGLEFFDLLGEDIFVKGRRYGRPFMDVVFTVGMSVFE